MTTAAPAQQPIAAPGPVNLPGPAQSPWLVHFCGRPPGTSPNAGLRPDIAQMQPPERLKSIVWTQCIYGSVPFGATRPAVSFSEASPAHLAWLVQQRRFPGWGLVFDKQAIFKQGGGPVWHARPDQAAAAAGTPAAEWIVRYDTRAGARSDWTHEQEWRLHTDGLQLAGSGIIGLLVEDEDWNPNRWLRFPVRADGTPTLDAGEAVDEQTQWWAPPPPSWPLPRFRVDAVTGTLNLVTAA